VIDDQLKSLNLVLSGNFERENYKDCDWRKLSARLSICYFNLKGFTNVSNIFLQKICLDIQSNSSII